MPGRPPLQQIYTAFDGTVKGISFRDLVSGLVVFTRGTTEERTAFVFHVYGGAASTGSLSKTDMNAMLLPGDSLQAVAELFNQV